MPTGKPQSHFGDGQYILREASGVATKRLGDILIRSSNLALRFTNDLGVRETRSYERTGEYVTHLDNSINSKMKVPRSFCIKTEGNTSRARGENSGGAKARSVSVRGSCCK